MHLVDFLPFFQGRQPVWCIVGLFCTPVVFWKGVYSKMKEFAPWRSKFLHFRVDPFSKSVYSKRKEFSPWRSKFFHFRVDPFSEEEQNNFDSTASNCKSGHYFKGKAASTQQCLPKAQAKGIINWNENENQHFVQNRANKRSEKRTTKETATKNYTVLEILPLSGFIQQNVTLIIMFPNFPRKQD